MKQGIRLLLIVVLVFLSRRVLLAQHELTESEIKAILQDRVERVAKGSAIVVGLVDVQGARVIGYGKSDKESNQTVNGDSVFEIGSVSKVFTTILLADMVERGEVGLNDPISKYLPKSVKTPLRNGKEITLLHLATHTSGLPWMPGNFKPTLRIVGPTRSIICPICVNYPTLYADYSVAQMYAFLSKYKLPRDIEAQFDYSNFGMALLGQILALRAGTDYETLVRTRIGQPLTMDYTGVNLTPEMRKHLATGHDEKGKPIANLGMPTLNAAGGILSTTNDLLIFVAANLGLRPSSLLPAMQRSHQPQYNTGMANLQIGLGWQILKQFDGEVVWHSGKTFGYKAFIGFEPKQRRGVVVLWNSRNDHEDITTEIGLHLLDETQYPLDIAPKDRKGITLDPGILDAYVGEYQTLEAQGVSDGLELKPVLIIKVTREGGRLFVQPAGGKKVEILAGTERDFFWQGHDAKTSLNVEDARATFVKDEKGNVTHLVLHWDGYHQPARKIN